MTGRFPIGAVAVLALLAFGAPAAAECRTAGDFEGLGTITTKGGGSYVYGLTIGGPAVTRGTLEGRPDGLPDSTFDLVTPYHIDFAGEGLARRIAPDAALAEAAGTSLSVTFTPDTRLPEARSGAGWSGKMSAKVYAMGPEDANLRPIARGDLYGIYVFPDAISAQIDGCSYRIQPVELTLTLDGTTALKRRILYFPDLGVSAITRWGPDADGPERVTGVSGFGGSE